MHPSGKSTVNRWLRSLGSMGSREERQRVASYIDKAPNVASRLRAHDWTMNSTLKLSGGLAVEKTDDGFKIYAPKEEDVSEANCRVIYSR